MIVISCHILGSIKKVKDDISYVLFKQKYTYVLKKSYGQANIDKYKKIVHRNIS